MKFKKIIVEDKILYLKRDGKSFRVVHPIKNDDGSLNWFNLFTGGSWKNLIITGVIILIFTGLLLEYSKNINMFLNCFKDYMSLELCKQSFGTNLTSIVLP